ncbi:MAG: peptidoglycan-binding protein [Ornithinimicrobium sp.]|uniref:peptidoglycan-binding domain-containing protein n=1 Tax=Ornithinimicrobium sp. TaxID=1977084 RepID=UPI0026E00FF9|nr:peptidoglycan-binding protein [Ornithinimicrobium sp.]MDO5738529.1 peptidoglycan-binding protein [Ornithinimicrobium sp.]
MNVEPWHVLAAGDVRRFLVRAAQHLLRQAGKTITADGFFGPLTESAVRDLQTASGLGTTGQIDAATWRKLVVATRRGDSSEAVRAVQASQLGGTIGEPDLLVDGAFGPATEARVRNFQSMWGLSLDGVAGPETWSFVSAPPRELWPLVKVGALMSDNWRVRAVQHLLVHHGATLTVDGSYGAASGESMRQFQLSQRATYVSTTTGQLDWPALIATVRRGDSNSAVAAVQSLLPEVSEDGVFGPLTEQAVRDLQDVFLPPSDGVVGPLTWHMLVVPKSE